MTFEAGDLGWISPFLTLAAVGMLLVLAEAFYKGKDRTALVGLAVAGSIAAAVASVVLYRQLGPGESHAVFSDGKGGLDARRRSPSATCCRRCSASRTR